MMPSKVSDRPPLVFRIAKNLIRSKVRGGHRLCNMAADWGMLDVLVQYRLARGIVFSVPIAGEDYRWDEKDLARYEHDAIGHFRAAMDGLSGVTMFDCGADIGTFSAMLCAASPAVSRIVAFEPNGKVLEILKRNMAALPVEAEVRPEAVGNIDGTGALVSPDYDASAHARFVEPGAGGITIRRIDSLGRRDPHVALKIDVEGGELEVLEGARGVIAEAKTAAVSFEAHPDVARRIGRDPVECIRFLNGIRPFEFMVAETGEKLSPERPLSAGKWDSVLNIFGKTV